MIVFFMFKQPSRDFIEPLQKLLLDAKMKNPFIYAFRGIQIIRDTFEHFSDPQLKHFLFKDKMFFQEFLGFGP